MEEKLKIIAQYDLPNLFLKVLEFYPSQNKLATAIGVSGAVLTSVRKHEWKNISAKKLLFIGSFLQTDFAIKQGDGSELSDEQVVLNLRQLAKNGDYDDLLSYYRIVKSKLMEVKYIYLT